MDADHASLYILIGACILVVLVIAPFRAGLIWCLTKGWKPVLDWLKVAMHIIVSAHMNVLRNFQPRQKLLYELDKKRTSYTQGD